MSAPLHTSDATPNGAPSNQQTYFHTQRAHLVNEIAAALDSTLTHLNRLNRSLESVIGIGNEFSNVEALWSQFEGVMGNGGAGGKDGEKAQGGEKGVEAGAEDIEGEKESALETPPVARTGFGGRWERAR
jgi:DASH complex subunit DAD1